METKHSPLPWRIDSTDRCRIIDANGDLVATLVLWPHSANDGSLLLTACNSHAALVAACKLAIEQPTWHNTATVLKAALALAEGTNDKTS